MRKRGNKRVPKGRKRDIECDRESGRRNNESKRVRMEGGCRKEGTK